MRHHRHTAMIAALGAAGALVLMAPRAHAQPNPFEAYEGKKQTEKERPPARTQAPTEGAGECDCEAEGLASPQIRSDTLTRRGNFLVGGAGAFSFTTTSNETESGRVGNNTLFVRLGPNVGYFLIDRLEVGASVGVLWRQLARSTDEGSTGRDLLMESRVRYHLPVTGRFSLIPGLSVGAYVGRNDRDILVEEDGEMRTTQEETRTFGLAAGLQLDLGYMLAERVQLQAGLGTVGLIGAERVPSAQESFGVRTFNTSLSLGIAYYF